MLTTKELTLPPLFTERNFLTVTNFKERPKANIFLGSDVEGPFYLGDAITEAMAALLKPKNDVIEATPSYGQIIYESGWEWLHTDTSGKRRGIVFDGRSRSSYSLSQEGTDTVFAIPLLLAEGGDYAYVRKLTHASKSTPGSESLVRTLEGQGVFIVGITTAPQEPYRSLVKERGFLDPTHIVGTPFPIDETRDLLEATGRWDTEISTVREYLRDCYRVIDEESEISSGRNGLMRKLSTKGRQRLLDQVEKFYRGDLGISYDPQTRRTRSGQISMLGQIVEAIGVVGDRGKAAVAFSAYRRIGNPTTTFVTMGDGANDAVMLQKAPISIGLNGADAATAAKIGVVTNTMINVLPIFEQVLNGQTDIDAIVKNAQAEVGDSALIHKGGQNIEPAILEEHKKMKRRLRGQNITY
ncbi:MAG: hypothetical protein HYY87_00205 [Candidatus Levybacteria bacterium]|nr:hypothetical protein [Candidatus Levybacteria bacterium]MBI3069712.1 hypothetical protein [Candidatus Levybacteria bacterium]